MGSKFNWVPVISLVIGAAGLFTANVTGWLSSHTEVVSVLIGLHQIIGHFLEPVLNKAKE